MSVLRKKAKALRKVEVSQKKMVEGEWMRVFKYVKI